MRRNLIIVRAGKESRHAEWLEGTSDRNFDLFVSYYGNENEPELEQARSRADHFEACVGMKWPRLYELWSERRDWLSGYDAVWFPDDDISSDGAGVCRMFDLLHEHGLWLAQPALGPSSHVSHAMTRRHARFTLRYTSFVEVMCPVFSRATLERLAYTFGQSVSGWGLDYLWPHLLGYPHDRVAVLDAAPVVHTRPQGTGSNYVRCADLGVSPRFEALRIMKRHGIPRPLHKTYGSILARRSA